MTCDMEELIEYPMNTAFFTQGDPGALVNITWLTHFPICLFCGTRGVFKTAASTSGAQRVPLFGWWSLESFLRRLV